MNEPNILPSPRAASVSTQTLKFKTPLTQKALLSLHQPFGEFRKRAERAYADAGVKLKLLELDDYEEDAFKLEVGPGGAIVCARGARGLFYGHLTLLQVLAQYPREVPCCVIEDAPDSARRVFHLDLRIHRYRPAYLRTVFAELARLRYNAVLIQYDESFPFRKEQCLVGAVHYTTEAIADISHYAEEEGLMVVPYLTVMGTAAWITGLERYSYLRKEGLGGGISLDTANPKTAKLMCALAEELIAAHKAPWLFIGTDDVENRCPLPATGDHAAYLDAIVTCVTRRGATPALWADMVCGEGDRPASIQGEAVLVARCGGDGRLAAQASGRKDGITAVAIPCRADEDTDFARDTLGAVRRMHDICMSVKGTAPRAVFVTSCNISGTGVTAMANPPISLMRGGRRMHLAATWYAIAAAAEHAWRRGAADDKQLGAKWPRYWFGVDDPKFSDIQFNHSGCVTDRAQAPKIIRDRRKVIQAVRDLKPAMHRDQLAMLDFYARLAVHALHVRQMFSRTPTAQQAALLRNEVARLKSLHASATASLLFPTEAAEERDYYFGHTEMLLARLARKL